MTSRQLIIGIRIPEGVRFADLNLSRDHVTGYVRFDWAPLRLICEASGIDLAILTDQSEDNVSELLVQWYAAHRAFGGAPDPVLEQLLAEVEAEDRHGAANVQRGPTEPQ